MPSYRSGFIILVLILLLQRGIFCACRRMTGVEIAVRFLAFYLMSVVAGSATTGRSPLVPFRLYTEFHAEPPAVIREAMQKEIEFIISPIGWQVEWDSLRNAVVGDSSVSLAVVYFKGTCDVADLGAEGTPAAILAATSVTDGRVQPYSSVNCSAIRALLAPVLISVASPVRELTFGRALGRVVAHELYHILTNERTHGSNGIGAAQFSAQELTCSVFRFGQREVKKLRSNLLQIVLSYNALTGTGVGARSSIYFVSGCSGCHGWQGEGTQWGPPLRKDSKAYEPAALAALLTNTSSKMHQQAKDLNVLWPRLESAQIRALSAYLKNRFE